MADTATHLIVAEEVVGELRADHQVRLPTRLASAQYTQYDRTADPTPPARPDLPALQRIRGRRL